MLDARVWQNLAKGTSDHDPVSVGLRLDQAPPGELKPRIWNSSD